MPVIGDARDAPTLRRAAVGRASHLICLAGADDVNAEIALRAADLTGDRQGAALICLAHILDPDLCVLMRSEELASSHRTGSRLDFFSIEEQGARVMLREHSPFPLDDPEGSAAVPDVLVVGLNRLGQSLVAEMARHWRSHPMARGRPMTITAVDPDAERIVDRLRSRFPQLDHAATLVPVTVRLDPLDPAVVESSHATTAYVCIDHETLAVRVALEVRRAIDADAAVVVELVRAAGLARLVERPSRIDHVAAFDLFDRTMRAELLLGGTYELLAQTIHEGYVEEQRRHGATEASNPSMAPWVRLAPTLRESNRDQAAHIGTKLAAIGQGIAPLTDWDAHEKGFTDEQVELLAEMEHERWVAQRVRDGWTPGPRDPEARTTPYLVDWDALAEETKELDRQAVRAIPELLSRAGYQIVSART